MTNPYAPPSTGSTAEYVARKDRLLYVWIWLATAIVGAMLATPADLVDIMLAMAFALVCFLAGVTWVSNVRRRLRWTLTTTCVIVAGLLAVVTWFPLNPEHVATAIVFAVVNFILGVKVSTVLVHNRSQIISTLSLSYVLGFWLGPLGVILLTIPSVLLANRNRVADDK